MASELRICLKTPEMAAALGFCATWLTLNAATLKSLGAKCHDGRWHISTTENAFLEACHRGLLGRTNPKNVATSGRRSKRDVDPRSKPADSGA